MSSKTAIRKAAYTSGQESKKKGIEKNKGRKYKSDRFIFANDGANRKIDERTKKSQIQKENLKKMILQFYVCFSV